MSLKIVGLIILTSCLALISSCQKDSPVTNNRIIIGIQSDVQTFNPLYAFSLDEGNINELLYLSLVSFDWDDEKGDIIPKPMLANRWEWNSDSTSITFFLRDDVIWSDSEKVTAEDIIYSFELYSDPVVQSKLLGSFKSLYLKEDGSVDTEKSFLTEDPYTLKINFIAESSPTFYELIFPLIPKHIFEKINREEIGTSKVNFEPVTNGPYRIKNWKKNQSISLEANENSFLQTDISIKEIVFKIIPDYNSRLNQLKKGEIDLTELVKPDDIKELTESDHLTISTVSGRDFDYLGWNNIDPDIYAKNKKIVPNKFFGDALTRKALSLSVNRNEILREYLIGYGQLSSGPVSPIFRSAIDSFYKALPYDISLAKELFKQAGWKDEDKNGVLERKGTEFRFNLYVPTGNPRRAYASTVVKNNLEQVGIDVTVQPVEIGVLIDDLYSRKLDAWMIGLFIPIPVDLRSFWFSDIENTPMNFVSYRSNYVDSLIVELEKRIPLQDKNKILKELQQKLNEDSPVTFMYWIDNIVVYNNRIKNADINPLGVVHHCWDWSVK